MSLSSPCSSSTGCSSSGQIDKEMKLFLKKVNQHGYNVEHLKDLKPTIFSNLANFLPLQIHRLIHAIIDFATFVLLIACILALFWFLLLGSYYSGFISLETLNSVHSRVFNLAKNASTYIDYFSYECLVDNFKEGDLFRPPQDCKFCHDLSSIASVRDISREEFTSKYAYSRVPLLITGATQNWTAHRYFSYAMFKTIYTKKQRDSNQGYAYASKPTDEQQAPPTCQFFPYSSGFNSLEEVFSMSPEDAVNVSFTGKPWYVGWSNCNPDIAEILRRHYSKPKFLPKYSESSRLDWIFMGSPGHGAPMHIDHVNYPSWQAQIKGTKEWILKPPYECRYECPNSILVTVRPGDIFVFDSNVWYHATKIIGEEMSLTIGSEYD